MTMRRLNRNEIAGIVGSDSRAIRAFERLLADVQANIVGSSMINVAYNTDGTIAEPLPLLVTFQLVPEGGEAFTSGVSWGVTVVSGAFVGAGPTAGGTGTGIIQINSGLASNTVTLAVTASVNGRGYPPLSVVVSKSLAGMEGSVTGDSVTSFLSFNTNTFQPVTRDLLVTLGPSTTEAPLTAAALSLFLDNDAPGGDTEVEMKWQRETAPAVWTDVGTTETSFPNPNIDELVEPGSPSFYLASPGAITVNHTETGLSAGSSQKFRLVARVSAGNIRVVTIIGTASVGGGTSSGGGGGSGTVTSVTGTGTVSGLTLTGTVTTSGNITLGGTLSVATASIQDGAVTYGKMQDASAASVLIGRGQGAGAGDLQELTLGTGLSLAGTVLSASSGLSGTATITVTGVGGQLEWTQTVAAVGVTASDIILISVAPADSDDENDAELLDIAAVSARPLTDQLEITVAFLTRTNGPITFNWSAF